jgi:uncharacterized protein YkwD
MDARLTRRAARALVGALLITSLMATAAHAAADPLLPAAGRCEGDSDPRAHHRVQRLAMHCVIDHVRLAAGLPRLVPSADLRHSATFKARRIAACRVFTHSPCGDSLAVPFQQAQLPRMRRWRVGENLAWGVGRASTAHDVVGRWLRSPAHRAVLLTEGFEYLGVRRRRLAMQGAPRGAVIWVAHLGRPATG